MISAAVFWYTLARSSIRSPFPSFRFYYSLSSFFLFLANEGKQARKFSFSPFFLCTPCTRSSYEFMQKKKEEESIKLNITRGTTTTHSRIYGAFLSFPPFLFCVWVGDHMGEEKGGRDQRREGPPRVKKKFPSSFPAATAAAASLPEKTRTYFVQ